MMKNSLASIIALPEYRLIPLKVPNPNRRWWQFWKPKFIWNSQHPVADLICEHNKILDELPWTEITDANFG